MINPFTVKLMVLLILACQIHAADLDFMSTFRKLDATADFIPFKVDTGDYGQFSEKRHECTESINKIDMDISILDFLTGSWAQPLHWQLQGLSCGGGDKTALAIRMDNLDIVGFANRTGHWYSFQGWEHLIPGSIGLGFENNYDVLIGGHMELTTKVSLDRSSTSDASRVLSNCNPDTVDRQKELKLALATLKVIASESQRFTRINEQIRLCWQSENCFISRRDAELVLKWREISEALVDWKKSGSWGGKHERTLAEVGITNNVEAAAVVRLVCNPPPED